MFKAFKEVYQYYLYFWLPHHHSARIRRVQVFEEPNSVPTRGPLVNMAAENEHVPDIESRIRVVK